MKYFLLNITEKAHLLGLNKTYAFYCFETQKDKEKKLLVGTLTMT